MKGTYLGEFEELVLLSTAILTGNAYSVTIADAIEEQSGRKITLSTVHTALYRLEKKGFVNSYMGGSIAERGGRRKRLYRITVAGHGVLTEAREMRNRLWTLVPENIFNFY